MSRHFTLRVVVKRDGDWWVARGIERDIAAQAESLEDVAFEFERMLVTHAVLDLQEGREPLSLLPRAPQDVEDAWNAGFIAMPLSRPHFATTHPLPPIQMDLRMVG